MSTANHKYLWQDLTRNKSGEVKESGGEAVSIEDLEDPEVEALVELLDVQRRGGDEHGVAAAGTHAHYPLITSLRSQNLEPEGQ